MRKVGILMLVGVMMFMVVGISGAQAASTKVAMVVAGTLGDRSFYDSGNEGLMQASKELGVETKVFECRNVPSAFSEQIIAAAQSYEVCVHNWMGIGGSLVGNRSGISGGEIYSY